MATNPLLATANGTEQARTRSAFPDLPRPTNINHPNATISSKTRHFLHHAAQEKFLFNHQPVTETPTHPNNAPAANLDESAPSGRVV